MTSMSQILDVTIRIKSIICHGLVKINENQLGRREHNVGGI